MKKSLKNKKKNEVARMSYGFSIFSLSTPKKEEKKKVAKLSGPKVVNAKKGLRLLEFVKEAIVANGGNYDDVYQKMFAINAFAQRSKELGVDCEMYKILEGTKDFFVGDPSIVRFQQKNDTWMANYQKKDENSYNNVRSMFVMQHEKTDMPVLYFGQNRSAAEFHSKNTYFLFCEDKVYFLDEYDASYDEFQLWGNGTKAQFEFDDKNQLIKVVTQKRHERLNWIWNDPKTFIFEEGRLKLQDQSQDKTEKLSEGQKALPKGKLEEKTK